jgi:hypothetical protein
MCASDQEHIYYTAKLFRDMKANRILLIIIAAVAIFATPSVLISPVLAQTDTGTESTGDDRSENVNQGTIGQGGGADDEPPGGMYEEFKTCLENEERTGGTIGFVLEGDIRACFIEAGYVQDDDNQDEDENEGDNEGGNEETDN